MGSGGNQQKKQSSFGGWCDIYYNNGIVLEAEDHKLVIDPSKGCEEHDADYVLVTHPHADHYGGIWEFPYVKKVMNHVTYEIISYRNPRKKIQDVKFIENSLNLGPFEVRTYPAGHTIGSLQFEIVHNGTTIAYTGDFCIESRLGIDRGVIIPNPDVLIIDCTYGSLEYQFPKRTEIYKQIVEWVTRTISKGSCPVISVRPLGTAQEVTKLLNVTGKTFELYVHPTIFHLNAIYRGYLEIFEDLGYAPAKRIEEIIELPNSVFLTPFWDMFDNPNENFGICSGWLIDDPRDRTFPLSNHSGFDQILSYIKMAKPKQVRTVHGNKDTMAPYLRQQGYDAEPL